MTGAPRPARLLRRAAALVCAALAAACGSNSGGETDALRGLQAAVVQGVTARRPEPLAPGATPTLPGLTRANLEKLGRPAELITLEKRAATAIVFPSGTNRGVETWASADRKSVSWRDGVIVATRGLGTDLMAAEAPPAARIAAGGAWERVHVHLDSLDQIVRIRFSCTGASAGPARIVIVERAYDTRLVRETCVSAQGERFVNEYWFGSSGILRQSRQWAGNDLGFIATRRLRE